MNLQNWRTTSAGMVPVLLMIGYKLYFKEPVTMQDALVCAALLGIGAAAKDSNVHSTEGEVKVATAEKNAAALKVSNSN